MANILAQDAYLGRTTNFKTTKLSYKSKKTVENPPEKWVTFENTHEAIIDLDTWDTVQKARQQRRRPTKLGDMGMFSGMIYCADCGQKLYEDNYSGKLTDERFAKLSEGYEKEQTELKAAVEKLRADVDDAEEQARDIERFTKIVRKYLYPTELTPSLLHSLVDKIIVHEREKADGKGTQKIEILYSFVGANEFSPEYHKK